MGKAIKLVCFNEMTRCAMVIETDTVAEAANKLELFALDICTKVSDAKDKKQEIRLYMMCIVVHGCTAFDVMDGHTIVSKE